MAEFPERRIHEFSLVGRSRAYRSASLVREHGFTRADFRRWQDKFGMPIVYRDPTAAQLAALRSWRTKQSRARAWAAYRKAAEALEDSEVPPCDGAKTDRYERVALRSWVAPSRALLVCEKMYVVEALDEWKDRKRPSFSYAERVSLATIPWLPSRQAVGAIAAHAREAQVPIAFFGDLDPQAAHHVAPHCAGRAEALTITASQTKRRVPRHGLVMDGVARTNRARAPDVHHRDA